MSSGITVVATDAYFTHTIDVVENTTVSALCGDCCSSADLHFCWNVGRTQFIGNDAIDTLYVSVQDIGDSSHCISQVNYTATSKPLRGDQKDNSFFCVNRNTSDKTQLPICFNGGVYYMLIVNVISQNQTTTEGIVLV